MSYYHPDAVRNRERVYIVHESCGYPIPSGSVYGSLDEALTALRLYDIAWNDRKAVVCARYRYRGLGGLWIHERDAVIRIFDSRDRPINHDVVYARVLAIRAARLDGYYNSSRPRYTAEDFRNGPVVNVGKRRRIHWRRHIRTTNERRAAEHVYYDEDCIEHGVRPRACRNLLNLPSWHDDPGRADYRDRSWKTNRKTQWKEV